MCGKTKHGYIDPAFDTIFKFIESLFTILIHIFVGNLTKDENFTYTIYLRQSMDTLTQLLKRFSSLSNPFLQY